VSTFFLHQPSCVYAIPTETLRSLRSEVYELPDMQSAHDHRRLLRMIAFRVREEIDSSAGSKSRTPLTELGRNNTNLKTVAILPVNRHVPVDAFGRKLHAALEAAGASTSYLNQASVSDHLGKHAFTKVGKLKAAGWLADLEERYRIVLYVADSSVTNSWTHTCIRQVGPAAPSLVPGLM
jgi:lysophospholipid hydrolase